MRTTLQPAVQGTRRVPQHIRRRGGSLKPVNDDHGQSFAADLGGLPMAVAQHETRCASGGGGFHLDELALRLGQRISARQKVADDGLQMAVAQETPRNKRPHPRRGFGGVEPFLSFGAHGVPDFHLLILIRIRVLEMERCRRGKHWTCGRAAPIRKGTRNSPLQSGGAPVQARFHLRAAERPPCSGPEGLESRSHP